MATLFAGKLQLLTYNFPGFNTTKISYLRHLLQQADLCFLQENWSGDKQINVLNNVSAIHYVMGTSGFDNSGVSRPSIWRMRNFLGSLMYSHMR
jgi:hypothetical protein